MLGISFSELLVILVVALLVIGPERLPKVACVLGRLFGRLQRYLDGIRAEIAWHVEQEEPYKKQSEILNEQPETLPGMQDTAPKS